MVLICKSIADKCQFVNKLQANTSVKYLYIYITSKNH